MIKTPKSYTSEQLAYILGIKPKTLYAYKSEAYGKINIKPANGNRRTGWLYSREDCIRLIQDRQKISRQAAEIIFSDKVNAMGLHKEK
jgi:hypothetical protein